MKRKVLITGATGGIGYSLAESFLKENYFVILSGRNKTKLNKLLKSSKNNIDFYECDLSNSNKLEYVAREILNKYKNVEVLVNNAGINQDSLFLRMNIEKWDNVLNVNLRSNFILTNILLKNMIKNKYGRIINITSVVCHTGNFGQSNYTASKSGIIGMSKSVAQEVAKRNITVNCISPGFIETQMTDSLTEAQKEAILSNIPMAKYGSPNDVANCATFLASEKASYITGQTIHVNGGLLMI